jgi:hypothetical protein
MDAYEEQKHDLRVFYAEAMISELVGRGYTILERSAYNRMIAEIERLNAELSKARAISNGMDQAE